MLSLIERGFFWGSVDNSGDWRQHNAQAPIPASESSSPIGFTVSAESWGSVDRGFKGKLRVKNTAESKPLVAVLLHKRKEGKHEERSPWQAVSQGTGATTESWGWAPGAAGSVPCPPTMPTHQPLNINTTKLVSVACLSCNCMVAVQHCHSPGGRADILLHLEPALVAPSSASRTELHITAGRCQGTWQSTEHWITAGKKKSHESQMEFFTLLCTCKDKNHLSYLLLQGSTCEDSEWICQQEKDRNTDDSYWCSI